VQNAMAVARVRVYECVKRETVAKAVQEDVEEMPLIRQSLYLIWRTFLLQRFHPRFDLVQLADNHIMNE